GAASDRRRLPSRRQRGCNAGDDTADQYAGRGRPVLCAGVRPGNHQRGSGRVCPQDRSPVIDAYEEFLAAYPEYAGTHEIDALGDREYRRLDDQHHVYLDYTGGSLHAESQVTQHARLLNTHIFGNPHSASPSSHATTTLVEETRQAVLDWFNAPRDEYVATFPRNPPGPLKPFGGRYPFSQGPALLLPTDIHHSVTATGKSERAKEPRVKSAPLTVRYL